MPRNEKATGEANALVSRAAWSAPGLSPDIYKPRGYCWCMEHITSWIKNSIKVLCGIDIVILGYPFSPPFPTTSQCLFITSQCLFILCAQNYHILWSCLNARWIWIVTCGTKCALLIYAILQRGCIFMVENPMTSLVRLLIFLRVFVCLCDEGLLLIVV